MKITDMFEGVTYNFSTIESWDNLGLQHTSFRFVETRLFKGAVEKADVYTMFYGTAIANGYDLESSRFYIFEDLNKATHILPTWFIEEDTPEPTATYPVNVKLFEIDNVSLESLRHILSTNGYNFTIEEG